LPSSLGFITSLSGVRNSDLGFSVSDYINSDKFLKYVLENEYNIDGEKKTLVDYWGASYNKIFSINPIGMLLRINRNLNLAKNLSIDDKKFLSAKEALLSNISYSEDPRTSLNIITITVDTFPELSKEIAKLAFESIIDYSNEVTNTKGKEKRGFIESRLSEVKKDLENAENKMLLFLEKNKNLDSPSLILQSDRLERNIMLHNQLYLSLSDQLELAKIDEKDNTSPIFLLDNATLSSYKSGRSMFESIILLLIILFIIFASFEIYKNKEELFT
jgi:uncharacterized protein involved in exopolysaccharide biosynthesis